MRGRRISLIPDPDNAETFRAYLSVLDEATFDDRRIEEKAKLIKDGLRDFLFNPDELDSLVPLNTSALGARTLQIVASRSVSPDAVETLFYFLARFAREKILRSSSWRTGEYALVEYFLKPASQLSELERHQSDYIWASMPMLIVDEKFSRIDSLRRELESSKSSVSQATEELERRIEGYRSNLVKLAENFNFVGLVQAFKNLIEVKRGEKRVAFVGLISFGFAAILLPTFLLIQPTLSPLNVADSSQWSPVVVLRGIAVLGIEVLLLYFFRILLRTYLAIRGQITNLQLRHSLCAFVEGYVEFSKRAGKDKDGYSPLTQFEQLVFGDLPADLGALPSTVEGAEHLAKIAEALRR